MMVCTTEEETQELEEKESPKKKDSKDKKYVWNHGSALRFCGDSTSCNREPVVQFSELVTKK